MLLSDRVTGGAVAALGAAAAYVGAQLPPVPGQEVGPAAFPTLIGLLLILCGGLIAFGVGRSFEDEAEAAVEESEVAHGAPHAAPPTPLRSLKAALPPALLLFYVLAVDRLGFVPTTFLMIVAMVFAFGGRWRLALALGTIGPVAVHLVFYKLLRVPLPAGLLPMPWS
ncbi:tripartite tricarboxylate transporter TctB family protein [Enterovirga rhinocerotis]|uniref:Putative tricarboxylic transport membrane protein n=1 Tax=Enterovirga rhinocerotis TaxID=1339210 RepID=A0A4R7C655_9HYPH|nr:tripartite tricarboxylate transporter TctB family protein [Enterovirga rhinocerotis]TDR94054.1 putative tricarboxylic transport membrane protein [Enterovirga rhinocerotis]